MMSYVVLLDHSPLNESDDVIIICVQSFLI